MPKILLSSLVVLSFFLTSSAYSAGCIVKQGTTYTSVPCPGEAKKSPRAPVYGEGAAYPGIASISGAASGSAPGSAPPNPNHWAAGTLYHGPDFHMRCGADQRVVNRECTQAEWEANNARFAACLKRFSGRSQADIRFATSHFVSQGGCF